jgi:hypothetical protein
LSRAPTAISSSPRRNVGFQTAPARLARRRGWNWSQSTGADRGGRYSPRQWRSHQRERSRGSAW